jgi:hypothetical protein
MLDCTVLATDLQRRVQRLLSGDCRTEDLDRIFLGLRGRTGCRTSLREIGDFVAHRDQREKGPITQRVRDLAVSCHSWTWQQFGRGPSLKQAIVIAEANLRIATDAQLDNKFKLKRAVVRSVLKQAISKVQAGKNLTDREYRIFNYLGTAFIWNPMFRDSEVIDDLGFALRDAGLITKADQDRLPIIGPFIALYVIALMHGAAILLDNGGRIDLRASPDAEERLVVLASFMFPNMPKPVYAPICIFYTEHRAKDFVSQELLDDLEGWAGPLDIDRAGKLAKL